MNEEASVRLDVWLWAARWFRTRSLAKEAIEAGRVLADGQPCKRSRPVRPGQKLEIHRAGERYEIQVLALSTRRGGAPEAARLYRESDGSRQRRERERLQRQAERAGYQPPPRRPDKRARRLIRTLGDIDMS